MGACWLFLFYWAGCKPRVAIDTAKFAQTFELASAAKRQEAEQALTLVKAANYPPAMATLHSLVLDNDLSHEEKNAVAGLVGQIQDELARQRAKRDGVEKPALDPVPRASRP